MPAAGCLPQRLLCVDEAAAVAVCPESFPTAKRTLHPARMLTESLNPGPELENSEVGGRPVRVMSTSAGFLPAVGDDPMF
jgi:hypothetical protein